MGLRWVGENLILVLSLCPYKRKKVIYPFEFKNECIIFFKPWQHDSDKETINKYVRHNQQSIMNSNYSINLMMYRWNSHMLIFWEVLMQNLAPMGLLSWSSLFDSNFDGVLQLCTHANYLEVIFFCSCIILSACFSFIGVWRKKCRLRDQNQELKELYLLKRSRWRYLTFIWPYFMNVKW